VAEAVRTRKGRDAAGDAGRTPGAPARAGGDPVPGGPGAVRARVDAALARILDREAAGLPAGAADVLRWAVLGPGKRLRPALLLAAHRAAGGDPDAEAAVELGCSVELVHAYSLVHDDLPCMDDDVLRRGRPTVHVKHGTPAAVLAGAVLMPIAATTVWRAASDLGLDEGRARRLLAALTQAAGAGGMVGGQLADLRAEGRPVSRKELEGIHRRKTAALMSAAVRMGALAARAPEEAVERLTRFGRTLGLAFQAVDDILDVTGQDAEMGKTSGRDAALGKATYPSVLGLEEAGRVSRELAARAREELGGIGGTSELEALVDAVVERRR